MKLTGKCKEEFENWFIENYENYGFVSIWSKLANHYPQSTDFYDLPESMQIGVYEDYFDSVGVIIEIEADYFNGWNFMGFVTTRKGDYKKTIDYKNRLKVRVEAIEKANEIRNEHLNK